MRSGPQSLVVVTVFTMLLLAGGCLLPGFWPGGANGIGTLRLLVTDKPYPVDLIASAEVTITRVEVRRAQSTADTADDAEDDSDVVDDTDSATDEDTVGAPDEINDTDEVSGDDEDSDGTFVTVFSGERTFDLLELQNGRTDLLADAAIRAGAYTQVRLIVSGGRIVLTDDRAFELEVPSGEQTGIKLNLTLEVEADQVTTLLLDVDLSRAFEPVPAGQITDPSGISEFKFHPAFGMRLINLLEAGSVSGTVTIADGTPLGDVLVTAYEGDDDVTSTATDPDGTYQLIGLHTATYRLEFSAPNYADATVDGVAVQAGEDTIGANVVLTANAQ